MKKALIIILTLLAILYLLNPTAGIWEILPDNIPLIGNVDETLAAYVIFSAISYFRGKDVGLFGSSANVPAP